LACVLEKMASQLGFYGFRDKNNGLRCIGGLSKLTVFDRYFLIATAEYLAGAVQSV
jgi:hypothetical protein